MTSLALLDIQQVLKDWTVTPRGDYLRKGYLITIDTLDNTRIVYDSEGNLLPEKFRSYYSALKHVNAILDGD